MEVAKQDLSHCQYQERMGTKAQNSVLGGTQQGRASQRAVGMERGCKDEG